MNPQEYIQSKLIELQKPLDVPKPSNQEELCDAIFKLVMSKKFRKYSANEELVESIKQAIMLNVEANNPVNFTFLHGAYKLWRLKESPEVDWAELFSLMFYSNWVKPICEIYEPGVIFDFFVDDLIIPMLDNIELSDVEAYVTSYNELVNFLKKYQPNNLHMTITRVGDQFNSAEDFNKSIAKNLAQLNKEGLPELTDSQKAMVELNTKVKAEQSKDPQWQAKVYQLHNAYMVTKSEPGYHKGRPEKILVFTQPLPSGTTISVGTTKDSIMKFWIGAGVLKPKEGSFRQIILSPNQLRQASSTWQPISIDGLDGKNFDRIRVLTD